jgi:hypothetical protein
MRLRRQVPTCHACIGMGDPWSCAREDSNPQPSDPLSIHCWTVVRHSGNVPLGESGVHPVKPYSDPAGPGCGSSTTRDVSDGRNAA